MQKPQEGTWVDAAAKLSTGHEAHGKLFARSKGDFHSPDSSPGSSHVFEIHLSFPVTLFAVSEDPAQVAQRTEYWEN